MGNGVVAHPDGTTSSVAKECLERAPGFGAQSLDRPMDQVEIHVVEAELARASVKGAKRAVVAVVAVPQLGGDKDAIPRYCALSDRFADIPLVAVDMSGVEVAIAHRQRIDHGLPRLLSRG